jgi:hypothetical protein
MSLTIRRTRCSGCLKSMTGTDRCQCTHPQPERIEMKVLKPLKLEQLEIKKDIAACVQ